MDQFLIFLIVVLLVGNQVRERSETNAFFALLRIILEIVAVAGMIDFVYQNISQTL